MFKLLEVPGKLANPFKRISLDDTYSRMNRVYLFLTTIIFGTIVTLNDYTGNKIECHGFKIFEYHFHENYCWTQGIYTILEGYDIKGLNLPYPGVLPDVIACFDFTYPNGTEYKCPSGASVLPLTRVYHLWYQWIPFYFWACAVVFYLPYMIFHNSQIGGLKPLIAMLLDTVDTREEEQAKITKAAKWLSNRMQSYMRANMGFIHWLFVRHMFIFIIIAMKIMNLISVILVFYLTDKIFVQGSFLWYGIDFIRYEYSSESYKSSPLDKLFPKMAACEIKKWGTSGIEEENGMCVLAPNVINSYFFLIFWFILAAGVLVNTVSVLFSAPLHLFVAGKYKAMLERTLTRNTEKRKWLYCSSGCSGQITLDVISSNVPPRTFNKLYDNVCESVVADKASLPSSS